MKIFPKRLLNKEIKKAGLKFNPGLGLIGLWTTEPRCLNSAVSDNDSNNILRHLLHPLIWPNWLQTKKTVAYWCAYFKENHYKGRKQRKFTHPSLFQLEVLTNFFNFLCLVPGFFFTFVLALLSIFIFPHSESRFICRHITNITLSNWNQMFMQLWFKNQDVLLQKDPFWVI